MLVAYTGNSKMAEKTEYNTIFSNQFKAFYLRYAGEMIFFARKFVDHQTAEDIVHDIFLKIWDRKSTLIVSSEIKAYLHSMVQNACYDHIKHKTIQGSFIEQTIQQLKIDELEYFQSAKDDPFDPNQLEAVYTAIEQLPPRSKDIFKKAYIEGAKHTTIAQEMNISIRTVETHIYKSLKFLRNNLITFVSLLLSFNW